MVRLTSTLFPLRHPHSQVVPQGRVGGGRRLGAHIKWLSGQAPKAYPPPPLSKLHPCPSYSRRKDGISLVPNLIRYQV